MGRHKPHRIVVLASAIGEKNTGIGHYSKQLLEHLVPLVDRYRCQIRIIMPEDGILRIDNGLADIIRLPAEKDKGVRRILAEQLFVPIISLKTDVFLSLDSQLPLTPVFSERKLVVMHDIHPIQHARQPKQYPGDYTRRYLLWAGLSMKRAVRTADCIITDTKYIAKDLELVLGVDHRRISTIYCGIDFQRFSPTRDRAGIERIARSHNLPPRYYLFVGPPSVRKNLQLIVDAYQSHARDLGVSEILLPVVCAGAISRRIYEPCLSRITSSSVGSRFIFLDYVPDEDMPYLYSGAVAFLCPSFYEGFGIPPLEAMACGTPVLASNSSTLPEILGNASLYVDPTRPGTLIDALVKLKDPLVRSELVQRGLAHVRFFSWERAAEEMANLIFA